jgi:hypothetical protein
MAHVAFDLDRTLGFFEIVGPLAYLWSKDFLTNPEQASVNNPLLSSQKLEVSLRRARETFARSLLAEPDLLYTVLRPNIDAMILPLLKQKSRVKSIIIYSNTGISYTVELAKFLIETKYKSRGLFSLTADHWHPLRKDDYVDILTEPKKTIGTLQKLFKRSTMNQREVPLQNILFVDDRSPKHELKAQEAGGLTYLIPTGFVPKISNKQKDNILFLAIASLEKHGLLKSEEYLDSGFCHRIIPYSHTRRIHIHGFIELIDFIRISMHSANDTPTDWKIDTQIIRDKINGFLENIKQ